GRQAMEIGIRRAGRVVQHPVMLDRVGGIKNKDRRDANEVRDRLPFELLPTPDDEPLAVRIGPGDGLAHGQLRREEWNLTQGILSQPSERAATSEPAWEHCTGCGNRTTRFSAEKGLLAAGMASPLSTMEAGCYSHSSPRSASLERLACPFSSPRRVVTTLM